MSTSKRSLSSINALIETRDVIKMKNKTGNLYESIAVISRRANQLSVTMKEELHRKLDEFTIHGDNLEEVHENKEQIEISRIYERMANPALQAVNEFLMTESTIVKNSSLNIYLEEAADIGSFFI